MGDRGGSSSGAWAPASYTRSFSLRAATWNKAAQTLRAPAERRVVAEHPGDTPVLLTCPPSALPPRPSSQVAPHLSLELLADGGVLADVTVQADHVALQLRWGHGGEICLFIQSSFWQLLPMARHC